MYSQVYRHSTKWRACDKMRTNWELLFVSGQEERLESMTDYLSVFLVRRSFKDERSKKVHVPS